MGHSEVVKRSQEARANSKKGSAFRAPWSRTNRSGWGLSGAHDSSLTVRRCLRCATVSNATVTRNTVPPAMGDTCDVWHVGRITRRVPSMEPGPLPPGGGQHCPLWDDPDPRRGCLAFTANPALRARPKSCRTLQGATHRLQLREDVSDGPGRARCRSARRSGLLTRTPPCVEHPEVDWFPARGGSTEAAKVLSAACLVRGSVSNTRSPKGSSGACGVRSPDLNGRRYGVVGSWMPQMSQPSRMRQHASVPPSWRNSSPAHSRSASSWSSVQPATVPPTCSIWAPGHVAIAGTVRTTRDAAGLGTEPRGRPLAGIMRDGQPRDSAEG